MRLLASNGWLARLKAQSRSRGGLLEELAQTRDGDRWIRVE